METYKSKGKNHIQKSKKIKKVNFEEIPLKIIKKLSQKIFSETFYSKCFLPDDLCYLYLKHNDKIIGMSFVKFHSPNRHFYNETENSKIPYILNFGVIPETQRKGIGADLLKFIIDDLKEQNYTCINLDVEYDNILAINFYLRNGFQVIDEFSIAQKRYIAMTLLL